MEKLSGLRQVGKLRNIGLVAVSGLALLVDSVGLAGCDGNIQYVNETKNEIRQKYPQRQDVIKDYEEVEDLYRSDRKKFNQKLSCFNENEEEIMEDIGGIEGLRKDGPWMKLKNKRLHDFDKVAIINAYEEMGKILENVIHQRW